MPLPTVDGKISVATLVETIEAGALRTADPPGRALSITQGTEAGTVYTVREVRELAAAAHAKGLLVHMDGARFANAVARLGCTPAELTWKAGVDVLSFGATKNGALCAEAVVFFNRGLAETFRYRRRRAGHHYSKMRLISAQWLAFLENDLWLRNARHGNAMAARVRQGLADLPGIRFAHPTEINFVLTALPEAGLGRPGRRRLQLLPARCAPGRGGPDRVRLRYAGRGGGRADRGRSSPRRARAGRRRGGIPLMR